MKLKKKIAALVAALTTISATVFAEQPAAEQYREMFRSGDFCVKYGVGLVSQTQIATGADFTGRQIQVDKYKQGPVYLIVAGNNGRRMKGIFGNNGRAIGFQGEFMQLHKRKKNPDVLYSDGKYYRMLSEKDVTIFPIPIFGGTKTSISVRALMLPADKLYLESLDPTEGWNHIRKDLSLPDELAIFCWDEPYRDNSSEGETPYFLKSAKTSVNGRSYDYDEYAVDTKSISGAILSQDVYRAMYENGNLVYVQKFFVRDGIEELTGMIDIRAFTAEAPAELFELPKGSEIYAADEGKIYDLTDQGLLVEKVGAKPGQNETVDVDDEEN